jgi:hypothetical protein
MYMAIDMLDDKAPWGIRQTAWENADQDRRNELIQLLADALNTELANIETRAYVGGMGWG